MLKTTSPFWVKTSVLLLVILSLTSSPLSFAGEEEAEIEWNNQSNLLDLPEELLIEVAKNLNSTTLNQLALASRKLNRIANDLEVRNLVEERERKALIGTWELRTPISSDGYLKIYKKLKIELDRVTVIATCDFGGFKLEVQASSRAEITHNKITILEKNSKRVERQSYWSGAIYHCSADIFPDSFNYSPPEDLVTFFGEGPEEMPNRVYYRVN
jgi:hypothetical protein